MISLIAPSWNDYQLIDSGSGQRLERFGPHLVVRPDPNVVWAQTCPEHSGWKKPDLCYAANSSKQPWRGNEALLTGWEIAYGPASFWVQPTPFRHLGIFPEQAAHWQWLQKSITESSGPVKVLNLFAYTGAASVIAALAGAEVCHVDASKASIYKAKDNARRSGLSETAIRWIVDDVLKFLRREVRRGNHYDLIIMDPPVFGRGPKGEMWRLEENIQELVSLAKQLFSSNPRGFLLNFYATSLYPESFARLVAQEELPLSLELGSLSLQDTSKGLLQTGFFLRS